MSHGYVKKPEGIRHLFQAWKKWYITSITLKLSIKITIVSLAMTVL